LRGPFVFGGAVGWRWQRTRVAGQAVPVGAAPWVKIRRRAGLIRRFHVGIMFDAIRKYQRVLLIILLLLIFPAFVFFGVSGYDQFLSDDDSVAKVEGDRITRQAFDQAMRRRLEQLREVLGDQIDASLLDTAEARREILDGLIVERLLAQQADRRHLSVSDAQLRATILEIPGLRKPDGGFDMARYQALLKGQGLTEASFEAQLRRDQILRLLPDAAGAGAWMPGTVVDRLIALQEERRDIRILRLVPRDFAAGVRPTDDQLRKHYDDNASAFETPESASVEYLVLSAEDLARGVSLSEDDLRTYYEQNKARYGAPEQRRASHILIRLEPGAPPAERERAMTRARALAAQARGGADFAALARANSQDPGSAVQGGDLGLFTRDAMVKPFADAAFALKVGEISDVVESDFGLHVIRVSAIQPAGEQPFATVRGAIEAELRRQQAGRQFVEAAEAFTNLVYEQSDSLKPAAERFKLTIRTAPDVERRPSPEAGKSPLAHPRLLAALFADDAVKNRRNTDAIEVGSNTLVAARILEHRPAQRKPFEAVRADVLAQVVERESQRLAREAGEARLKALRGGEAAPSALAPVRTIGRAADPQLPGDTVDAIFRAPASSLPAWVGVTLPDGGYLIAQVLKVAPPTAERVAERRAAYASQLQRLQAQQDVASWLASLKARASIERFESRLAERSERSR
jgi:peptidyl-prolyl cis-trans isomerase D